jgi:hypothetical protein
MSRLYRVILRRETIVEIVGESDEGAARHRAASAALEGLIRRPFDTGDAEVDKVDREAVRPADLPKDPTQL